MTAAALIDSNVTRADILRWGAAGTIILAAHATVIAGYVLLHHPNPPAGGEPVVLVEMAAIASAPEAAPLDIPEEKPAQQSEPEPEVVKPPEQLPPPPPPVVTEAVPLPEPPPPKPQVKPKKPPAPRTVTAARAPTQAATASAAPLGVSGAEARAAQATWRDLVAAHLRRYKGNPSKEGDVLVGFAVDRNGHVLSRRIVRGSGHSELDAEALAMIQRAQPLPAFPPGMTQARTDVTVPLHFVVR
jgi:periplasmic protein TonB